MMEHGKKIGILIPLLTILYGIYMSTESAPLLVETSKAVAKIKGTKIATNVDVRGVLDPFEMERALNEEMEDLNFDEEEKPSSNGLEGIKVVYRAGPFRMVRWQGEILRAGQTKGQMTIVKILPGEIHVSNEGKLLVLEGCKEEPLVNGVLVAGALRAAVLGGKIVASGDSLNGIKVVDVSMEEVTLTVDQVAVVCPVNPRPKVLPKEGKRS